MRVRVPPHACDTHMHFYDLSIPAAPGTFLVVRAELYSLALFPLLLLVLRRETGRRNVRVWLAIPATGRADCPYCGRIFIYRPGAPAGAAIGELAPPGVDAGDPTAAVDAEPQGSSEVPSKSERAGVATTREPH